MKKTKLLLLLLVLLSTRVWAIEYPIQSKTLANGLKIVVCEKNTNNMAEIQVWYRVGSKDEWDGVRGIARLPHRPPVRAFAEGLGIILDAQDGLSGLGVVAAVNSVIALFYYARVASVMWFRPTPAETAKTSAPSTTPSAEVCQIAHNATWPTSTAPANNTTPTSSPGCIDAAAASHSAATSPAVTSPGVWRATGKRATSRPAISSDAAHISDTDNVSPALRPFWSA